jgi:hypothetical protein
MRESGVPPSFDDIAVALKLAASQFKLDLEQLEMIAARVGVSPMGTSLAVAELQRNLDLVVHAHHFFKDGAPAEREVRAAVDRKKRGRWSVFTRAAAV